MKNIKSIQLILVLLLCISNITFAQEIESRYKISNKGIIKSYIEDDSITNELLILKPVFLFKSKYEISTESAVSRFLVRNSRLGIEGAASSLLSYKFMVELSSEGKFDILDLYARYNISDRFKITFGQGAIPLYNSYAITSSTLDYVNRPFVGKYFVSSRDVGLSTSYKLKKDGYPIAIEAGIYNGSGINNPLWSKSISYGARLAFGELKKGVRVTTKMYRKSESEIEDFIYWGADFRYKVGEFRFETEVLNRHNYYDDFSLFATYAQVAHVLPMNSSIFSNYEPLLRWDAMGYNIADKGFGVNRITTGVNLHFNIKSVTSKLFINYEHYFNNYQMLEFDAVEMNENKFSVELLIFF